jgi:HNH endonuclease
MSPRPQRPLDEFYIGEPNSGCWLWLGNINRDGYGTIWGTELKRTVLSHRLVYETLVGPIPPGQKVLHRCDNPCCVNPDHMMVGTTADNNADCKAKGRNARGERHGSNKLSTEQVLAIREATGTQRDIAARFNIHYVTVHQIKSGKRWKHLGGIQ